VTRRESRERGTPGSFVYAVYHAMCVSPEVIADVNDGSDYRKPESRTHEQRDLNEDSAGSGKH
jgi:hypothetical protein